MAVVEYADAIKTVSGALTKINKKSPHAQDQKMVLATHRKAETSSRQCSRIYFRGLSAVSRSTPVRENEAIARELFTQRAAWVMSRAASLQHLAQDQEDFLAQKDLAGGATTMKSYYWKLAKAQVTRESLNG